MTEPVKRPKRIYCFARRGIPLTPGQLAVLRPTLPDGVDFIAVELGLEQLDDRPYVAISFATRVIIHLNSLGVPREMAELLVALRMDYASKKAMQKGVKDEDWFKAKAEKAIIQQKKERAQQVLAERNKVLRSTAPGLYGEMGREFGKVYFFETQTKYLHYLEDQLKDYIDDTLQAVVNKYPDKMGWDEYHTAFGAFWRQVLVNRGSVQMHFDEPGIASVRKLAHYLFTWNFRRYMSGEIIARHARFLPRLYRHLHIAARCDRDATVEVDLDYPDAQFEDDTEEPGDNIGNH